jgi:hypothetical protein
LLSQWIIAMLKPAAATGVPGVAGVGKAVARAVMVAKRPEFEQNGMPALDIEAVLLALPQSKSGLYCLGLWSQ